MNTTAPGSYELAVYWSGLEVGNQTWQISPPPPPLVVLTPAQPGATEYTVDVAAVNPASPLGNFRAILFYNGTQVDEINPLAPDGTGILQFTDVTADGDLNGGDFFTIAQTTAGNYQLVIRWIDDTVVASQSWTI